jgi:MoaA/NifB/PqqE/SkfB family radical SAM enzyme
MDKQLKFVHLQLTARCNLRCSFCGQWGDAGYMRHAGNKRELNFLEWKTVIDSIFRHSEKEGLKPQFVIWGGEPLLSPSFAKIAELLKSYGFETGLVSNGTLLNEFAPIINKNINVVYVSIDGPEEIHDCVRNCAGTFQRLAEGLKQIDNSRTRIVTLTTICEDNYKCLVTLPEYIAERLPNVSLMLYQNMIYISPDDAQRYTAWFKNFCGRKPEHIASWISDGFGDYVNELPVIMREICQRIEQKRYPIDLRITPEDMTPENIMDWYSDGAYDAGCHCVMPFSHLHVRPGGNVDMCVDFDDFSAGNVREKDVMEIFNGPEAEKFRQKFLESPPPICRRCPWRCNRSPGLDMMKTKTTINSIKKGGGDDV